MDFLVILGCDTSLYHSQGGATELSINYHYVHFGTTAIKVLYFIPNSRKSNSNGNRNFHCMILLYCERNNLLFSTFLMHSIWWNGLHTLQRNLWYFVQWCCHLGNRFTTRSTNQRWLTDLLHFYGQKQLLLSSCLRHRNSVRPSVRPSVTRVDQSKAVQARITKFSPSGARNYRYAIQIENLVFCILTSREHPNFQLIYWTGTAIGFRASCEH